VVLASAVKSFKPLFGSTGAHLLDRNKFSLDLIDIGGQEEFCKLEGAWKLGMLKNTSR
jgi:hypothetical protein